MRRALLILALALLATVMLFPFVFMVLTALKSEAQLATPSLFPTGEWHWGNFAAAWQREPFTQFLINSALVAILSVVITVLLAAMGGYALSKHRFRGRHLIYLLILATMMVPSQVKMVPNFLTCARLGLLDSNLGLIIPMLPLGFGIFLMRQFTLGIPDDLLDAARVDGAGEFRIFVRVVLPLSLPALATLSIFTFMASWNEFLWPLIILDTPEKFTIPLGLMRFSQQHSTEQNLLMAVSFLTMIPVMILFIVFQRAFVQGVAGTGLSDGGA